MAMSRVASIRPHRLLPLVRLHACMSTEATSLAEKVLLAAKVQAGDVLVQNEADTELGKAVIKAAKERGISTINILPSKPGVNESIELLKSIGGDVVVTETYTNTWYMKRLISDLPKPTVGLNCGEGLQATAVAKLLKEGGTLLNCGKSLPQDVTYPGADRRPLKWDDLLKARKLNVKSV
ncbi:uncharacterized protein [Physcomitrium patens]|uniref:Alcohol dehydrogenase-like C-terminal domain-containing protein n=1 Tax=Physcomitrium patens TaxID=3218 RepID=A9RSM1_PHYPA|nr:enoyl-[acyl-carrier-protein] reductase, mitochondrial-like [Physcomitrium patens]PNR35879.1 hypothetical protein PHYPA_021729 [Physcomitrium patens]|eukprot:XP_024401076.1 enoyl-[acyl-carrier-protein] reductase, mitochondrial-like [Physcomitrella patens]